MDFTVDVDMFQNGAQNMYFRTVNDGSRDVTVLCDADGKAIQAIILSEYANVLFTVANNGTEIDTITDDTTYSREDIINACGGSVNVSVLYAGESVFLLVMGTHVQYCNADDTTTTPSVTELPPSPFPLKWRSVSWFDYKVLVNSQGAVLTDGTSLIIETGPDAQSIRVNAATNAHVAVPSGTSEAMCEITGDIWEGQTGNFTFIYEGQTYNVVDRICSPEITDIY